MRIEMARFDAVIRRADMAAIGGKADVISCIPPVVDQRRQQGAARRADIAVEKTPDMIAARMIRAIDQDYIEFRAFCGERQCDQTTRQPRADNRDIA